MAMNDPISAPEKHTPKARHVPGTGRELHRHVLVVLVNNQPGVLNRVSSMVRSRNFNIESLAVGHTERPDISRMTVTLRGDDFAVEQMGKQLYRLIDVLKVQDLPESGVVEHELALIAELDYAAYFLTVWHMVRFARERGILCQGRGSAANSAVCFCLGITEVDPARMEMLVERFISKERNEPPDIDVDFEHQRREEVIQYIYQKYGRERAALAATVITYRTRSALRDVGRALGLGLEQIESLVAAVAAWRRHSEITAQHLREAGFDPAEGKVTLMLHTFVGKSNEEVRELVREPMKDYLRSAMKLVIGYAWTF